MSRFRNDRLHWLLGPLAGVFMALAAVDALGDDLDVTMRMVEDDAELTRDLVRQIELPEPPARPSTPGDPGRGEAQRPAPGLELREARDSAREAARGIAEQAREQRQSIGRPDVPGKPPVGAGPDQPGMPDIPDTPESGGAPDGPSSPPAGPPSTPAGDNRP